MERSTSGPMPDGEEEDVEEAVPNTNRHYISQYGRHVPII